MKQEKISTAEQPIKEYKKPFVLLVDGNTVSELTTSLILQRLDYHVFSVKTAEEALTVVSIASPQVVLTEISLPQMDGIGLLQKLKDEKKTESIPVIVYTRQQDPTLRQVCLQSGCSGYLNYPAPPDQLYEAIQVATEDTPRHFVRFQTSLDVIVGAEGMPGHQVRKEKVSALSVNGMYVNTVKPLPYGTILPFTIFFRDTPGGSIHVEGKVLYSYSYDGRVGAVKQPGMGVKFTQLRAADKVFIKSFIQEKLLEGIANII
jgi:two-component system chemotaxis response regulator CheY